MMQTMNTPLSRLILFPIVALALLASCSKPTEPTLSSLGHNHAASVADIKALSPEASLATMELPSGYKLEPVLTEPEGAALATPPLALALSGAALAEGAGLGAGALSQPTQAHTSTQNIHVRRRTPSPPRQILAQAPGWCFIAPPA